MMEFKLCAQECCVITVATGVKASREDVLSNTVVVT
jgi:hypothetical protein